MTEWEPKGSKLCERHDTNDFLNCEAIRAKRFLLPLQLHLCPWCGASPLIAMNVRTTRHQPGREWIVRLYELLCGAYHELREWLDGTAVRIWKVLKHGSVPPQSIPGKLP